MATPPAESPAPQPAVPRLAVSAEPASVEELQAEVDRLRKLVGPSEDDYVKLRLDVLAARDAAMGAEMELGAAKGHIRALEANVVRLRRDHRWLRRAVVRRLVMVRGLLRSSPRIAANRLLKR